MIRNIINIILILTSSSLISCDRTADFENARKSINTADINTWVKDLGSDRFMGRAPFTAGEKITVEYLADQLKKIGFEPAFNGSYFQDVPMVRIISKVDGPVKVKGAAGQWNFHGLGTIDWKSVFLSE